MISAAIPRLSGRWGGKVLPQEARSGFNDFQFLFRRKILESLQNLGFAHEENGSGVMNNSIIDDRASADRRKQVSSGKSGTRRRQSINFDPFSLV
jgi:hypothetical protein